MRRGIESFIQTEIEEEIFAGVIQNMEKELKMTFTHSMRITDEDFTFWNR